MVEMARSFHLLLSHGKTTDKTALQTVWWCYLKK